MFGGVALLFLDGRASLRNPALKTATVTTMIQTFHLTVNRSYCCLKGKANYDKDDLCTKVGAKVCVAGRDSETDQTVSEGDGKISLKGEITPLSGVGFVVGNLIGSGIFITPSVILSYTDRIFRSKHGVLGIWCYCSVGQCTLLL